MAAPLPSLAFGENRVRCEAGLDGLLAAQRAAHRSLVAYEPLGIARDFCQKSVVVSIGNLTLVASAHTPVRVVVAASDDLTLMVPFCGWSTAIIEGREHRWLAGRSAMFVPGLARRGECGQRSTLTIGLDPARLEQAVCSVNEDANPAVIKTALTAPQRVNLTRGSFSFATALRRICGLIDSCLHQPEQLVHLGVDDMISRAVAMLLLPAPLLGAEASLTTPASKGPFDRACDYVVAHLFSPIRLEALEEASGVKARALQLAFLRYAGCTPRQWIIDRRLDAARARLTTPGPNQTVTSVALACGFMRMASFIQAYRDRFGELPSTTLARR